MSSLAVNWRSNHEIIIFVRSRVKGTFDLHRSKDQHQNLFLMKQCQSKEWAHFEWLGWEKSSTSLLSQAMKSHEGSFSIHLTLNYLLMVLEGSSCNKHSTLRKCSLHPVSLILGAGACTRRRKRIHSRKRVGWLRRKTLKESLTNLAQR